MHRTSSRILLAFLMFNNFIHTHYKHIIFDFGGVLLDGGPSHGGAAVKTEHWFRWMEGKLSQDELIDRLSMKFDRQEIEHLLSTTLSQTRPWIDETVNIIPKLQNTGYRVYILSNLAKEAHAAFIAQNPLFAKLDGVLCSFQAGCIKPDLKIYRLLCEQHGLNPEECIFIDDIQANVDAAEKIGMAGILYTQGYLVQSLLQLNVQL